MTFWWSYNLRKSLVETFRRDKPEPVLLWFIFLFGTGYSYQGDFVSQKCCTSICVRNVQHNLGGDLNLPQAVAPFTQSKLLLDRAQHSRLTWATSWVLAFSTQKLLKIHSNKLFLFSATTLQSGGAMIMLGAMISNNHFLVCTKNFASFFMDENDIKKILFTSEKQAKNPKCSNPAAGKTVAAWFREAWSSNQHEIKWSIIYLLAFLVHLPWFAYNLILWKLLETPVEFFFLLDVSSLSQMLA